MGPSLNRQLLIGGLAGLIPLTVIIMILGSPSRHPERPSAPSVTATASASAARAADLGPDPSAQAGKGDSEYRAALVDAGLSTHLADDRPAAARAADLPSRNDDGIPIAERARKTGRIRTATHLFDSKDSAKRAASAAARSGAIGYAAEASAHGVPIEQGESVIILERSWTGEFMRVLAADGSKTGWTYGDIVLADR